MVSIIVPAYNAEKTIEKCVASILAQKGVDKQIILVNDGSTDGTREVLRRLKVSHQTGAYPAHEMQGGKYARGNMLHLLTATTTTFPTHIFLIWSGVWMRILVWDWLFPDIRF